MNIQAKALIYDCTNSLFALYEEIKKVFEDARKISPGIITNVRMILASLRNKDAKDELERNIHKWEGFFAIMRHYTEVKLKNSSKEVK